jgi:hypothetical protein
MNKNEIQIDNQVRSVNSLIKTGRRELGKYSGCKRNSATLITLVNSWGYVASIDVREAIGTHMMRIIDDADHISDELAILVFEYVGTPIYTSPVDDTIRVIEKYLNETHTYAANWAAMKAMGRVGRAHEFDFSVVTNMETLNPISSGWSLLQIVP